MFHYRPSSPQNQKRSTNKCKLWKFAPEEEELYLSAMSLRCYKTFVSVLVNFSLFSDTLFIYNIPPTGDVHIYTTADTISIANQRKRIGQ